MKQDLAHPVESRGTPAADQDLTTESASPEITVTTHNDKAILIGTVRSWQERRAAEQAAWALPEVREIDDRLVVVPRDRER